MHPQPLPVGTEVLYQDGGSGYQLGVVRGCEDGQRIVVEERDGRVRREFLRFLLLTSTELGDADTRVYVDVGSCWEPRILRAHLGSEIRVSGAFEKESFFDKTVESSFVRTIVSSLASDAS